MDDLRRQFDSLDRLRAPDLWAEVELRAAAMSSAERLTQVETRTVVVPSRVNAGRPLAVLLVAAALLAALLAGALAVGSGWLRLPSGLLPSAACPIAINEADARDRFNSGLPADERAWLRPGTIQPAGRVRPGKIAALAYDLPGAPLRETIVTIDPVTGELCRLVELSRNYQTVPGASALVWSPTGDALAIGVGGRLFIWSEAGLARVWIGDAFPFVDWAPDGSSIAVWSGSMGRTKYSRRTQECITSLRTDRPIGYSIWITVARMARCVGREIDPLGRSPSDQRRWCPAGRTRCAELTERDLGRGRHLDPARPRACSVA